MSLAETAVHPTAVIYPGAELGQGVEVGPYCIVESGAEIADGCRLLPHAQVLGRVIMGENCVVGSSSVIGGEPQDTSYGGERTKVILGENCRLYDHVTVHRATGEGETRLGEGVLMMAGSHIGHNASVEQGVVLVNSAAVGGHATVGEKALLSQGSAIHQFGVVGRLSLLGGACMATKDVPPFSVVTGSYPVRWRGVNTIGLKRAGISSEDRTAIRRALHAIFHKGESTQKVAGDYLDNPCTLVAELATFILNTPRGICAGPRS